MRRIKDFFYDKNDIIIVVIILIIAALIIYWRIGVVMDYPGDKTTSSATETTEEAAASDDSGGGTNEAGEELISVKIEDSASAESAAKALEKAGLVASASDFQKYIKDQDKESSIKAGTFDIPMGSTQKDILKIITDSK